MTNNRAWFSYVDLIGSATIAADSEVAALPASNLKDRLSYRIYRSQSSTVVLSADFGSSKEWGHATLAFPAHRGPGSTADDEIATTDTIQITASDVSQSGTELYNETVSANVNRVRGYFTHVPTSAVTSRYVEITITATSRSGLNYIDLWNWRMGPLFYPQSNYSRGSQIDFSEQSLIGISPTGGATTVESRARLLGFEGTWGLIEPSNLDNWRAMQDATGITAPIVFGRNDTGNLARETMICRFADPIRFAFSDNGYATSRVALIESR